MTVKRESNRRCWELMRMTVHRVFPPSIGLIRDPLATLNERKHKNIWTEKERLIFKDK